LHAIRIYQGLSTFLVLLLTLRGQSYNLGRSSDSLLQVGPGDVLKVRVAANELLADEDLGHGGEAVVELAEVLLDSG